MKTKSSEKFLIKDGIQIDLEEGWKKIISRQFGGNPGKGFGELIQNFLDSYDKMVPWAKRRGEIRYGKDWISLRDFGSGLSIEKLRLATMMGGTDKSADPNKIGKFGIGLFSIFNPKLGTSRVELTTMCEGQAIRLSYLVQNNGSRPRLEYSILDGPINFSTEVKVCFDLSASVRRCLEYGKKSLKYYPCKVSLNGEKHHSVWDLATMQDAYHFDRKSANGFISQGSRYRSVTVLCKYEYIIETPIRYLVTGGHGVTHDLRDYGSKETPFLPSSETVINCNDLNLTISRDSYYLDYNFSSMISDLNYSLMEVLNTQYKSLLERVKLANLYILRKKTGVYLRNRTAGNKPENSVEQLYEKLVSERMFRINGRKGFFSLKQIKKMLSENTPLFFSEYNTNLRWLGGEFTHDFILLCETCLVENGAPDFYNDLFTEIFKDVVNLDQISSEQIKIRKLIERGIIRKEALDPVCEFIEVHNLSVEEKSAIDKLKHLLNKAAILEIIEKNIGIPIQHIQPVFFKLENEALHISTGIFDQLQNPISDDFVSNFLATENEQGMEKALGRKNKLLLGLSLNHPFVRKMVHSKDPHLEYYALTYIAHEITSCQRMLSPYSTFYKLVKARLSSQLRQAMIEEIIENV